MCYENCVNSGELSARKGGDNPERSQVIYGILRKWVVCLVEVKTKDKRRPVSEQNLQTILKGISKRINVKSVVDGLHLKHLLTCTVVESVLL